MPEATRSRYRRTSLTWPAAITTVPGSQTSASALMSFSGSPDSDRSTNRMLGLAETESVWTAFLSPPLLTFSGDQPCSTAIGRSISAVSSSVTKAAKGSRSAPAREAWKGAFMVLPTRCAVGRKRLAAGRLAFPIGSQRAAGDDHRALARGFAAAEQIVGVGDHRGQIAVGGAAVIGAGADRGFDPRILPARTARHARARAGGDDPDKARRHRALGHRRSVLGDEKPVIAGDLGDVVAGARRFVAARLVDHDMVAISEADRVEPGGEPGPLGGRDAAVVGGDVEHEIIVLHDRLVERIDAGIVRRRQQTGLSRAGA